MFTTASTHSIEDQCLFKFSSLLSLIDLFENKATLCLHQEEICYAGTIVEESCLSGRSVHAVQMFDSRAFLRRQYPR